MERMADLAEYFGGGHTLGKVVPEESYKKWFEAMKEQINSLGFTDSTYTGRKISNLIKALEDIEQYN